MNPQRIFAVVCVSLGLLAAPAAVWAQAGVLPAAVVESPDLSQAQKDEIKRYVDAHKEGLRGTPGEIKRSRNALLEPLQNQRVSVAFRLEYTRQLIPHLRALVGEKNEVVAVNSLRVAGELATAGSVDLLVEAVKDGRSGVRYAAASGFEDTFKAMQQSVPALGGAQALRTVDSLKAALEAEEEARVLEGLVLALQEALRISTRQVEGMRDAAMSAMAQAVSAKTADRKIGPEADAAFRRAVLAIRTAVTNPDINEPEFNQKSLKDGAGMAGDLLALVAERFKNDRATDYADLALMVSEAEKVIFFVQPKLLGAGSAAPKEYKLWEPVQQGDGPAYQQQVLQVIGRDGVLTGAPFHFPDNRFVK